MKYIEPKISLSVQVPVDTYVTVKNLSQEMKISMAEIVNAAIESYLDLHHVERYDLKKYERAKLKEEIRAEVMKELSEMTLF